MQRYCTIILLLILTFFTTTLQAQTGASGVFKFLEIPASTHAAALGGNNVSVIDDDLGLVYHNPGLMGREMDKMLSLNYTSYIGDFNLGNATFAKTTKRSGTFAAGIHFMNYGSFNETTEDNVQLGSFSAQDIAFCGFYSYDLTDRWRGGISTKLLYSHYADYNSFGVAVDLGLSYYNPDNEFSAGLVLKNMGGQIVAFNEIYERIPWDVQLGFTKQLAHAPLKISVTFQNMGEWDFKKKDDESDSGLKTSTNAFDQIMRHFVLGVDFTPGKNFYASVGYNYRRRTELKVGDRGGLTGFTAGTGIRVKSFRVGFSMAQYHVSGFSYHFNVAKNFGN